MKKISPFLIFLTFFSLLVAAGSWFLLAPQVRQLSSLQLQKQATELAISQPIVHGQTEAKQQAFQLDSVRAGQLLPVDDGQYDLIAQVEATIRGMGLPLSGLSVTSSSLAPPAGSVAGLKGLDLTITTQGTYANVQQAVANLTSLGRYISVSQLNISSGGKDKPLSVQIVASAYYLPKVK